MVNSHRLKTCSNESVGKRKMKDVIKTFSRRVEMIFHWKGVAIIRQDRDA